MSTKNIKVGCEIFLIKDDAAVIIKDNKILIAQRAKKDELYGKWEFPGGKMEPGETEQECLKRECVRRELKEELDIEGLEFKLISVADCINERGHYVHISFLFEKFTGEIRNMEPDLCYEWNFFPLSSLPEDLFDPHRNILKNYFENVLYLERKY
jgi:mutator protein MutT